MSDNARLFQFIGSHGGRWRLLSQRTLRGSSMPVAPALDVLGDDVVRTGAAWRLRGITTEDRYLRPAEKVLLQSRQESPGRPTDLRAVLIPIRKRPDWWALAQAQRREILGERSQHVRIGLDYVPAIARRLFHCRDLSEHEPFDFLTWFEFAPGDEPAFDALLERLRATPEWDFVDREVELRFAVDEGTPMLPS